MLKYDDEYRILQHTYGYPWCFDNNHLHEVMLLPRWAGSTGTVANGNNVGGGGRRLSNHRSGTSNLLLGLTPRQAKRFAEISTDHQGARRGTANSVIVATGRMAIKFAVNLMLATCTRMGNDGTKVQFFSSPLNLDAWTKELSDDPDRDFLLDGIQNGFQLLPKDAPIMPAEMNNYFSSTNPDAVDKVEETLLDEIEAGNYVPVTEKTRYHQCIRSYS